MSARVIGYGVVVGVVGDEIAIVAIVRLVCESLCQLVTHSTVLLPSTHASTSSLPTTLLLLPLHLHVLVDFLFDFVCAVWW